MNEQELLDEVAEIVTDPDLKVTAMRDRIRILLAEAGYWEEEGPEPEEAADGQEA